MEKIKISVAMLSAALENQNAVFSMQCTVMPVFQKFETGTHMKVEPVQSLMLRESRSRRSAAREKVAWL